MTQYKYNDWIYQLKDGNFDIEWPENIKLPETVYKYYPNTEYSFDAVLKQYLFCSHPYHLNDSIDSTSLLWDFSNLTEGVYNKFYAQYGLDQVYEVNYQKEKKNGFVNIKARFFELVSKNAGIISLTTEPLQTLMWAHYASESGFMVELDWQEIKNNLKKLNPKLNNYAFFPIQYVDNLESVDFFGKDFNSPDLPYIYSTGVKRKDWDYENEWRLIPFSMDYGIPNSLLGPYDDLLCKNERKLYYPKSTIKSIALGKRFFNGKNLEKVIDDRTYMLKKSKDLDFILFLMENFNDRIYFCGEYENSKVFKRSAEKIHFEQIDEQTIRIVREDEGFYQK
ncbi:DUF2971 domain-containing protein [Winogradskyella forsetii]|uniref:DUF2971 domain-containing protein n=1 Tax=Winogradskyella forsetii TaxID=2686077 RepID=UPI0015BB7D86|nr:DUF2971 domain-containing protein [Winogradskyella forsetii]